MDSEITSWLSENQGAQVSCLIVKVAEPSRANQFDVHPVSAETLSHQSASLASDCVDFNTVIVPSGKGSTSHAIILFCQMWLSCKVPSESFG